MYKMKKRNNRTIFCTQIFSSKTEITILTSEGYKMTLVGVARHHKNMLLKVFEFPSYQNFATLIYKFL